jgi:tetratricopeptide (TPR) repeat protein
MVDLADGDMSGAVSRLRTVIRLNPSDERARIALANALLENDQLDDAEQALNDTLRALPASGRAHYFLGLTYQRQGRRVDAIRELQAALTHKPLLGANTIHRMIGTLQQDEQDLDGAAQAYAARVNLIPNDHGAHRDLARVYSLQGDDVQARAELEIALLLSPGETDALTALGQLHLREGRPMDAMEASRRALEIDPGNREARYVHATSLIRLGNTDEGSAEMQVFQRLQSEDGEARARTFELGRLRREASVARAAGEYTTAVALLQRALVLEPRAATSHLDLGLALLEGGQIAAAIERLTTAAALNAPFDVHRHLAKAYATLGQKDESAKEQATYERLRREAIVKTGRAR